MIYSVEKLVTDIHNDFQNLISTKFDQITLKGKISEINFVEYNGYNYGKIEDDETSNNIQFKVPTALLPKLRLQVKFDLVGILYVKYNKKFGSLSPLFVISAIDERNRKEIFEGDRNIQQVASKIFTRAKIDVDYYLNNKSRVKLSVITGKNSKAKEDFERQLNGNYNYYSIHYKLINIESAYEVAKAIEDSQKDSDLIAITRGGGDSLKYLEDDIIFKAINLSKIPVISAVGHFSDYMLLNQVADLSLGTPSALGTYLKEHAWKINKRLNYQNNVRNASEQHTYTKRLYSSNSYRKGGCFNVILLVTIFYMILFHVF